MSLRASAFLAALLSLLAAGQALAADAPPAPVVTLYFTPDSAAPMARQMPAGDPALAAATPHSDPAKAAAGWMVLTLSENLTGYAPTNTSRKDLSIRPGTPIHQFPKSDSPVIGLAADNPETQIEASRGDWLEVTYPGPEVLYFLQVKAPPPPAPPAPPPAPAPPVAPTPEPESVASPNASATTSAPNQPHYYIGTLKLRTNPLIRGPVSAQYILVGNDGQLLALVDLSDVILPGPADEFLGKSVRVYGASEPADASLVVLIKAQLLQPN